MGNNTTIAPQNRQRMNLAVCPEGGRRHARAEVALRRPRTESSSRAGGDARLAFGRDPAGLRRHHPVHRAGHERERHVRAVRGVASATRGHADVAVQPDEFRRWGHDVGDVQRRDERDKHPGEQPHAWRGVDVVHHHCCWSERHFCERDVHALGHELAVRRVALHCGRDATAVDDDATFDDQSAVHHASAGDDHTVSADHDATWCQPRGRGSGTVLRRDPGAAGRADCRWAGSGGGAGRRCTEDDGLGEHRLVPDQCSRPLAP